MECLDVNDDRRESPQSAHSDAGVRIISDRRLGLGELSGFTGYNHILAKPEATVLAKVKEYNDPLSSYGNSVKAETPAFASDISALGRRLFAGKLANHLSRIRWLRFGTK